MRIVVVVPSILHKSTAGSRIRYDRLSAPGGVLDVVVQSLDELDAAEIDACEALILSKTYSVGAIAIASEARRRGKVVGVDLFDDYFSTPGDARLTRFRTWLRRFAGAFDFALSSTAAMRRSILDSAPSLPVLIVPDAYPEIDPDALRALLQARRQRVIDTGVLDILWFGIGSNPFFPAGLHDLASFAWSLGRVPQDPFELRLTILTDDASQTSGRLALLRRLPLPYRVETWSLEAEARALRTAALAFIPVNGQSFSRAKSLNRALTAISAGAQVLSPGFPLYADLGPAIYRDGAEIVPDLLVDRLRIRRDTVADVVRKTDELSALSSVMSELYVFLTAQIRAKTRRRARNPASVESGARQGLIVSQDTDRAMVAICRKLDVLSIRGPFSQTERPFDVRLDHVGGRDLRIWVRPEHVPLLAEPFRTGCSPPEAVGKIKMVRVEAGEPGRLEKALPVRPGEHRAVLLETAFFQEALLDVERLCGRMFPGMEFLTSDIRAYVGPEPVSDAAEVA